VNSDGVAASHNATMQQVELLGMDHKQKHTENLPLGYNQMRTKQY